jgi:lysophospholipase L1-like esterase
MDKRISAILLRTATATIGLLMGLVVMEGGFQYLDSLDDAKRGQEGACGPLFDDRWGWKLPPGKCLVRDPEFTASDSTNSLWMNDEPYQPAADDSKTRILALGDSHTQAVGVNTMETWPKYLQRDLNARFGEGLFRVYNGGTAAYNVHQYLLRLIDQGPVVKPDYVVVGFGYASDLYDLLSPEHGGWAFFSTLPRNYFDFDANGTLVEKHWAPPAEGTETPPAPVDQARVVRAFLEKFATFRYLRRSNLALAIGSRVRVGGQSLWPSMEVLVQKNISPEYKYNWDLAEAVLERMDIEAKRLGAQLIVVGVPYVPQVYDEIWNSTFGSNPNYSRDAGPNRLRDWLKSKKIPYVDTTAPLRERVKKVGHWVHYHKDAHPTAEGHEVMAEVLAKSDLFMPRR